MYDFYNNMKKEIKMNLLSLSQVLEKYPNIFKSEKQIKSYLSRNKYDIRKIALKISHQILFEEEKLLDWVRGMTYEYVHRDSHHK